MKVSAKYIATVLFLCSVAIGWLIASSDKYGPENVGFVVFLVFGGSVIGVLLGKADGIGTTAFLSRETLPLFMKIGDNYEVLSSWNLGGYNYYMIRKISTQLDGHMVAEDVFLIETFEIEFLPKRFTVWKESVSKKPKKTESRLIFHELPATK
jgi:hypothetical protein